jgi:hypothetical protein
LCLKHNLKKKNQQNKTKPTNQQHTITIINVFHSKTVNGIELFEQNTGHGLENASQVNKDCFSSQTLVNT